MADDKKYEYAVNEVPPIGHLLLSAFQHVLIMVVAIGIPIIFAGQLNETPAFTASLVTFSMLASGIGSIIQALRLPYLGSGYLCPNLCGPSYLSLSLSAAWIGGLPLMRGITIVADLIEMFLAPVIQKMKSIFPIYVVGLVVALVGISIVQISVTSFFGLDSGDDSYTGVLAKSSFCKKQSAFRDASVSFAAQSPEFSFRFAVSVNRHRHRQYVENLRQSSGRAEDVGAGTPGDQFCAYPQRHHCRWTGNNYFRLTGFDGRGYIIQ